MLKRLEVLGIAAFLTFSLVCCGEQRDAKPRSDRVDQARVLATVNGVPITELDVRLSARRVPHGEQVNPESIRNTLQTLVQNELIYQQSVELGLDANPAYRKKLEEVEAQVRAFQRQEMSALFRAHVNANAQVTDAAAQEYFQKNSTRLQTTFHILQIYYKGGESQIAKDYQDIKSGKSFEKVAARRFPTLPKNVKAPWDLGNLHWNQIPEVWQGTIDRLAPGQVSEIIKGPNERFWVIKLVDKTVDPKITFATEKEKIVEVLKKQKADELYETTLGRMKAKSKIVYSE